MTEPDPRESSRWFAHAWVVGLAGPVVLAQGIVLGAPDPMARIVGGLGVGATLWIPAVVLCLALAQIGTAGARHPRWTWLAGPTAVALMCGPCAAVQAHDPEGLHPMYAAASGLALLGWGGGWVAYVAIRARMRSGNAVVALVVAWSLVVGLALGEFLRWAFDD